MEERGKRKKSVRKRRGGRESEKKRERTRNVSKETYIFG
jgi:hypothetical protein